MKILVKDAIKNYWQVGHAIRHPKGDGKLETGVALDMLGIGDYLHPRHWRAQRHLYTLKFDIIEGNKKWRQVTIMKAEIFQLIPHTQKLMSLKIHS